jgi:hypothetical protein
MDDAWRSPSPISCGRCALPMADGPLPMAGVPLLMVDGLTSPWSTVAGSSRWPRPRARQTDAPPPGSRRRHPDPATGQRPHGTGTGLALARVAKLGPAAGLALTLVDPDPSASARIPLPAPAHDRPDRRRRELDPRHQPSRAVTAAASCGSASSVDGGRPVAGRHGRGRVPRIKWR